MKTYLHQTSKYLFLIHGYLGEIARVSAFVSREKHILIIMYTFSRNYWEQTRKTKDGLVYKIATEIM